MVDAVEVRTLTQHGRRCTGENTYPESGPGRTRCISADTSCRPECTAQNSSRIAPVYRDQTHCMVQNEKTCERHRVRLHILSLYLSFWLPFPFILFVLSSSLPPSLSLSLSPLPLSLSFAFSLPPSLSNFFSLCLYPFNFYNIRDFVSR